MKAQEILMFMLIFNLAIWWIGGIGFNLYNIGAMETEITGSGEENVDSGVSLMGEIAGMTIIFVFGSLAGAAFISVIPGVEVSTENAIYVAFSGVFWTSYIKTLQALNSVALTIPQIAGADLRGIIFYTLASIFTVVVIFVFTFGLMQMVTGGWKTVK